MGWGTICTQNAGRRGVVGVFVHCALGGLHSSPKSDNSPPPKCAPIPHNTLCHRNSFNPWCDVHGIFFLKSSYVSLIFKSRLVVKILASPFLSYILPQRGEIYNIRKIQTKPDYFFLIMLWIFLSQPYTPLGLFLIKQKCFCIPDKLALYRGNTPPFLSYKLLQRGEMSNIRKSQTKPA